MTHFRLLPIVIIAASALLLLKSAGYLMSEDSPVSAISSAAAQNVDEAETDEQPASAMDQGADSEKPAMDDKTKMQQAAGKDASEMTGQISDQSVKPNSEVLILQRLGDRREALERRASELDLREQLLNATELRVEQRVTELKSIENRIKVAESKQEDKAASRLNGLVQMYEGMKPKDAARVFNRLSLDILVEVVRQIKPRKMSAILAKMTPENAERLTVALATDRVMENKMAPKGSELPKIEGKPTN